MLTINFGDFPVLETPRLSLRQLTRTDAQLLFSLRSDVRTMKYIDKPLAKSIDEVIQLIEKCDGLFKNNEGLNWAITLKDNPKLIGNIGYWRSNLEHHRSEVGYMLHPDHWGKGLMEEALNAVLKYGFEQMNLHSIEANINPDNVTSGKLLEKVGFVKEGHFKENYYFDGKFIDTVIYSKLNPLH